MKHRLIVAVIALASGFHALTLTASESVTHSGQASQHSAEAIGHSVVAGAKVAASAAAIPLKISGAVGQASGQLGDELWDAANQPAGQPLPISEETVTIGPPPADALRMNGTQP